MRQSPHDGAICRCYRGRRQPSRIDPTGCGGAIAWTSEESIMSAQATASGRQLRINGADLFVEEHGQGSPVVLVQPGLVSSAAYGGLVPLLAERFRVIAFDSRGHGRSTNPSGELTYELIADDTAAVIEALALERPFVGGWSDGGEVALQLELRHPGVARGLIAGGTSLELGTEKAKASMRALFHSSDNDTVDIDAFARDWGDSLLPMMRHFHPNGEAHWQDVVRRSASMWLTYAGLTREKVARITAPALVLVGDRDEFIPVEEGVRLYRELPNAELAILPGCDHMRPLSDPASFARAVTDFLGRH
jgi:pimeloyl-ACP methyl ester carboxylesterase